MQKATARQRKQTPARQERYGGQVKVPGYPVSSLCSQLVSRWEGCAGCKEGFGRLRPFGLLQLWCLGSGSIVLKRLGVHVAMPSASFNSKALGNQTDIFLGRMYLISA